MAANETNLHTLDCGRNRHRRSTSSPSLDSGAVYNKSDRRCKIRKRVSQSSSSSSIVRNYKSKRAIFVSKKVISTTPAPTWKLIMVNSQSPLQSSNKTDGVKYIEYADSSDYNNHHQHDTNIYKVKEAMSARKLGATLWEIDALRSPARHNEEDVKEEPIRKRKSSKRVAKLLRHNPDTHSYDQIDVSQVEGHMRRSSASSHKLAITKDVGAGVQEILRNTNSFLVPNHHMIESRETNYIMKSQPRDVNNSLVASKELVKVLFRILSQEEQQHSSTLNLVSALRAELDRARRHTDALILQEQHFNSNQMDTLLKQFAEEKAMWKRKEKERMRETVSSLAREVRIERKLRRQCERLNKKLGKELADSRAQFSKALKELDRERRAREILEQTCDELARGIGEERVEAQELKKASAKAREEVEQERRMLQLADVLREERVQMKLAEARYEYEEKNAALETIKSKIETYLRTKAIGEEHENSSGLQEFLSQIQTSHLISDHNSCYMEGKEYPKRDSRDSNELSIELIMENNNNGYKWNFRSEGKGESRRASVDEVFKGRRSLSEVIQWENICLQRKTSGGSIEWDFTGHSDKQAKDKNGLSSRISSDCNEEGDETDNGDFNRHKTHELPFRRDSISPGISTGDSLRLREACRAILQDLASRREQLEGMVE